MDITKKVYPYVILGVALGALIHGFVPEDLVIKYLSNKSWYVVPIAVLMGVPLYANSVGVIPVIEALVGKGIPMGSALAFMTATVTLSLPEALMLKKLMKWQLLATFFWDNRLGNYGNWLPFQFLILGIGEAEFLILLSFLIHRVIVLARTPRTRLSVSDYVCLQRQ
ncbi:MAG: hypothetical protein KatS3mg087_0724 [Patescibacteria group bacterium]|nr:MAG: hypothetical protein KatS3mg087_0724 [Patescibacteria group bacterium]